MDESKVALAIEISTLRKDIDLNSTVIDKLNDKLVEYRLRNLSNSTSKISKRDKREMLEIRAKAIANVARKRMQLHALETPDKPEMYS